MKRKAKHADEYDVISSWRKYYCYLARAGATNAIKTRMRRRERREARAEIRKGTED